MSNRKHFPISLVLLFTIYPFAFVLCDSGNQPRIVSHDGDLVFESAQDRNITIRLKGASNLMVNDIDVLDAMQKVSVQLMPSGYLNGASLPDLMDLLKTDLRSLTKRLTRLENRTSSVQQGRIRRLVVRVRTLERRVNNLETKLKEDDCSSNPCKNGGTCYDLYDSFHCECPDAWTGKTCEQDLDECYTFAGTELGCQHNSQCINTAGGYQCICKNGFKGIHCQELGNDCSTSRPGELCGHGTCVPANNQLGYQCICDAGWKLDNQTQSCSKDVNECLEMLVPCHTSCINLPGSFICGPCPTGYTGNGVKCQDIDECATNNGGCSMSPKVQCINTEGSHRCGNCPPGWTGDGRYCSQSETNDCTASNICHPLARCEYISNTAVCVCPTGMTGSGYGPAGCRTGSADPCNEHQCQNGGTCVSRGRSYTCICPIGFEQPLCQNADPCASNPCINGGTCIRLVPTNDFRCECPASATGNLCERSKAPKACGTVFRERSGELTYPPEGGTYPPNVGCAWVIRTTTGQVLNITFTRFDIESHPECSKDFLQLNDGRSLATPLIGRFCGNQLPRGGNILLSQEAVFLWFHSDNETSASGFSLTWNTTAAACGGDMHLKLGDHGVIKSPRYPGKSPPNRECLWTITAPFGDRVLLQFFEIVMERSRNCSKNSLIVYDTNEVLERICESGIPSPRYTSSNVAKIHFSTDWNRENSLFQVHYEVVPGRPGCGGLFTEPEGKISFTLGMLGCVFLIQQPPGVRISLTFREMEQIMPMNYFIKIFDGKTEDDPVLMELRNVRPDNVTSSSNFMLIKVIMPSINSRTVFFEATYRLVCGEELNNPQGGVFHTPNYPQPYYKGLTCEYLISGPINTVVHLNFTDYDISEYPEACDDSSDYVKFFFKINGPGERHCKDSLMHIVAPNNYLRVEFHSRDNPERRRGIFATYRFETIECGGVLRDSEGTFQQLDPVGVRSTYCEWILEAPENHVISLDLQYERTGPKCATDDADLRIFLNRTEGEGQLIESYCGPEKRVITTIQSNLVTVFLKLITLAQSKSLVYYLDGKYKFLNSTEVCGGNYTTLSGYILSPGWPNEYPAFLDCEWVIHAPLGYKIELVVKNFTLEDSRQNNDFLEIRNGPSRTSPLIGQYWGTKIPPRIPSFTNHLYLRFRTDATIEYSGFEILYRQMATGCGGTLNAHSGSIASPHYPEISHGPVQCDWKIYVSQGSVIDVQITKLSREANLCSSNVLTIFDGDLTLTEPLKLNCSDSDAFIRFTSSSNVIHVRYTLPSVGAAEGEQFYLSYGTNCQRTIQAFNGVIESPNFPSIYPGLLRCEWTIIGHSSDTFNLTFSHFELESSNPDCIFDVVEVIDMKGDEQLQTHRFCTDPPEVLSSDGNRLVIKFKTDYQDGGVGFRLEFKRNGCGGYYTRSSAIFASPKYPFSIDMDCEWVIEVTPGLQIVLEIFDVHIESEKGCSANGLIVKNEKSDEREILKECKVILTPMTVTSYGRKMYVRFYSDANRSRKYFKASYRTRDSSCGGIFRGNSGVIMSPNYPRNYPENAYCEWLIRVESVSTIEYVFEDLSLPFGSNCSKGAVEVYEPPRRLSVNVCSEENGVKYTSKSNMINVVLNSRGGPPAKGFVMRFKKTCSGVLTATNGFLKSFITDEICRWTIQSNDTDAKISLNFMRIECSCEDMNATECHKMRGIEVATPAGMTLLSFCDHHPPDFISNSQQLVVIARNVNFIGKYSTLETACGGFLTSLRGTFTSPYYPESYPSNIECIWTLKGSLGNYLELNILEMDIEKSDNCNEDYLEIREGSSSGKLLGLFCSNTLPDESLRAFEQVWVKFHSSENTIGKLFKISWTHAQLNEIGGFSGRIQAPPIVAARSERNPFQWRITVTSDNVIRLLFKEYNGGLQLYDGYDSTALPIDIKLSPWNVTSHMNVIYLVSDNQLLDRFQISWQSVAKTAISTEQNSTDCGGTIVLSSDSMSPITSPGYPNGYDHNLKCEWLIKPSMTTEHVVVAINDIRLEFSESCPVDYLKIYSSPNLVDWTEELKVCDNSQIKKFSQTAVHGTPYLKMEFVTDQSLNVTGFDATAYPTCGSNLTGSAGQIPDSLFHPTHNHMRTLRLNCTWHVEVPSGRQIRFNFRFPFGSESIATETCTKIYALIRDGVTDGAPILPPGRICSSTKFNGTITTSSNRATIKYIFEDLNPFLATNRRLWNLTYRAFSDCGGEVRLTPDFSSLNISSPNYPNVPHPHVECSWTIVASPGEAIQAEVVDRFDMNIRKCSDEFVEFRDGGTQLAPMIGKYCTRPPVIRSTGNVLYVRYRTDIAEPRNGFKLNVSLSRCGGTFTQFKSAITSTNYPAPGGYPSNTVCEYVIKVPELYRLNLTFTDINLPYNAANINASERIEIYQTFSRASGNVNELLTVIYGNTTVMPAFEADTSTILIRFISLQANNMYRGFRLKYDRLFGSCMKDVNGESGVITSRLAPKAPAFVLFVSCRYRITVPKGRRVKARILEPGINSVSRPRTFTAMFCNDFMMTSKIATLDFLDASSYRYISSTDNRMYIRILGSQVFTRYTLQIEYSSSELSSCPDDITTDSGSISIAGLDQTQNFYCTSEVVLNRRETLVLNITKLSVTSITGRAPIYAVGIQHAQSRNSLQTLNKNGTNFLVRVAYRHALINFIQNEIVKLHQFEATFTKYPCGGEFFLPGQFSIIFANLTTTYTTGSLDCQWYFPYADSRAYNIFANLSFSLPCTDEYLVFHSGPSIDELQVAKLCQGSTFNTTRVTVIPFYVTYHTSAYNAGNPMRVDIRGATLCGGQLHVAAQQSIYLTSKDYKNNIECVWDLSTSRGMYLLVNFEGRFFIESSKDCLKDYLELRRQINGVWKTMVRYCGRDLPPSVNSTTDRLQLVFHTDGDVTGDGFSAKIRSTCDITVNVTNEHQQILSPIRWSLNRNRLKCNYVFQTNTDQYIEIKFKRFQLTSRNICSLRQMIVQKWSEAMGSMTSLEPWCDSRSATDLRGKKLIQLTYEDAIEAGDYIIEYSLNTCDEIITKPGWIESLKNDDGSTYSANMKCMWRINAPSGHNIFIQLKYVDMEKIDGCTLDYVAVYRGPKVDNTQRLGKLCGNLTYNAPSFLIDGNQGVVTAISDSSVEYKGFLAQIMFSKVCDERLSLSEANTPVNIERELEVTDDEVVICVYRLMAPPEYRIQIEIAELELNAKNVTCTDACDGCNFVEILNSFRNGHFTFGRYCKASSVKSKAVTTYKDAVIRVNLEHPGRHRFKINLQLARSYCNDQTEYKLEDASAFQLVNPRRSDGLYPANIHCTWKFYSERPFDLTFSSFSLQNESDVTGFCLDYVHIRYTTAIGNTVKNDEHCGTISSYTVPVNSGTTNYFAEVTFHTDETIESKGFTLTAAIKLPCNVVYRDLSGTIKIETDKEMSCANDIILPENYTINTIMTSLSFSSDNCSVNSLKVFDKKTNRQIDENCRFQFGTKTLFLSTNEIRLNLKAPSHFSLSLSYYASLRSPLLGCGGSIQTPHGLIISPNYQTYRNRSSCRWNLTTTATNRFRLFFNDFNMGSVCKTDYLDIYEIAKDGKETLARQHCGSELPESYRSKNNRIAIVSVVSADFDGTGWQIAYEMMENEANRNNFMDAVNRVIFDNTEMSDIA